MKTSSHKDMLNLMQKVQYEKLEKGGHVPVMVWPTSGLHDYYRDAWQGGTGP
jgi:hypothetical protein